MTVIKNCMNRIHQILAPKEINYDIRDPYGQSVDVYRGV